jgi:lipoyl(octanoyl) transferase
MPATDSQFSNCQITQFQNHQMISVVQLGTVDYATGLRLQQQLVTLRKEEKIGDVLLLLEHTPVITRGRNAKAANIIASPELLAQRKVELFECDRGGDVTFHGPGQIVGYPIFDLREYATPDGKRKTLGAVDFIRRLEEVLIRTCADFAIPTKRVQGLTGVWTAAEATTTNVETNDARVGTGALARPVERCSTPAAESEPYVEDPHCGEGHDFSRAVKPEQKNAALTAEVNEAKLAAIGIHISRFVTSHGFALNVNTDLSYFNLIIPCGITSKPVTSMRQELSKELDLNAVAESISRNFGVVFQSQMLWVDTLDALLGRTVGVPMQVPAELRKLHHEDDTALA